MSSDALIDTVAEAIDRVRDDAWLAETIARAAIVACLEGLAEEAEKHHNTSKSGYVYIGSSSYELPDDPLVVLDSDETEYSIGDNVAYWLRERAKGIAGE